MDASQYTYECTVDGDVYVCRAAWVSIVTLFIDLIDLDEKIDLDPESGPNQGFVDIMTPYAIPSVGQDGRQL